MKRTFVITLVVLSFIACKSTPDMNLDNKQGDLGNGYYLNPILGGDYPDPSVVRDGEDYYMTHSAFDYLPGLIVYHSNDLVNWQPISYALKTYLGSIWAPDITKYGDKYYIYFTVAYHPGYSNYVVYSDSPYGPWSDPIDLKIGNIDPCHIVGEDGSRWMFLSNGYRVKLADDGLSVVPGTLEKVYDGWQYPSDWITACFCLEGPKLRYINGYYYYLNAQGGTAGPPTSHMVVMARSKSINGPWENSPYNPVVHTWDNNERWWCKGHGSLIDTPDEAWYIVYHGYENGYVNLGRQTLMEPLEWTEDGWFKVPSNIQTDKPIKKPIASEPQPDRRTYLGEFRVGLDWKFYKDYDTSRFSVKNSVLNMKAKGDSPFTTSPILFVSGNHAYEIEVEIDIEPNTTAGIVLFHNDKFLVGSGFNSDNRYSYRSSGPAKRGEHQNVNHLWLRLRNDHHVVTGSYSFDGVIWERDDWGMEVSGYSHNTFYDFQSLLPGLFVCGEGKATFKNFKYVAL